MKCVDGQHLQCLLGTDICRLQVVLTAPSGVSLLLYLHDVVHLLLVTHTQTLQLNVLSAGKVPLHCVVVHMSAVKPAVDLCRRRYAAYKASHEGDSASLKASQAAEQLWWDDKRTLLETAAAAEAEAAAAASAKYVWSEALHWNANGMPVQVTVVHENAMRPLQPCACYDQEIGPCSRRPPCLVFLVSGACTWNLATEVCHDLTRSMQYAAEQDCWHMGLQPTHMTFIDTGG